MSKDTYRVRMVFEKCLHTSIGNWCDTQELASRIFFGVSIDKVETGNEFIRGCKILDNHSQLQSALAAKDKRIKELEEIYLGQIRVIARSRITHKEKVIRMVELAEQALTKDEGGNEVDV